MLLPLVNLQELSLGKNNIVRINSLERLASLRQLNVENNLIVDFSALKKHQNFGSFKIQNQRQPSIAQVKLASKDFLHRRSGYSSQQHELNEEKVKCQQYNHTQSVKQTKQQRNECDATGSGVHSIVKLSVTMSQECHVILLLKK
ncbi:Leucine-rich_repeat domain superfamily [Hexamita inflata]|uniref:Leucine-rich repeat domain superfamily n=1 Tax=Hexamita inflata TaxID=28002 RepID=A0AA86V376_9EUKA|nr:Leucine-rich repeat domain superfamily [Hexamita inflata]CAI9974519.1 Leucine-rich repeat domain superfamily [Hexamita inflata]